MRDRWVVKIGDGPDLDVQGNVLDHEYTFTDGRTPVATVSRRWFRVADSYGGSDDIPFFDKFGYFRTERESYDRRHGDWSLSPTYDGPVPDTRFMDIDSAASTPIIGFSGRLDEVGYLRSELTAVGYYLAPERFSALVIGPGGGRDLLSALVFGARLADGVEINPIIARDVMSDRFLAFSGGLYRRPDVRVFVEDGRSFVRRSPDRYDVIQASLVDTWAATAAGAYTLTENSLYTVEAFEDYLDHLSDRGLLTITRWALDGLRLVSLAQEACARRGLGASSRLAIVQHEKVATFILKKAPFAPAEVARLREVCDRLQFTILYAPGLPAPATLEDTGQGQWQAPAGSPNDYAKLVAAPDRQAFYARYPLDITPTTDDRPFFFKTDSKLLNGVFAFVVPDNVAAFAFADGFFLEETDSLMAPVNWRISPLTPVLSNGVFTVTAPVAGAATRFLRLVTTP